MAESVIPEARRRRSTLGSDFAILVFLAGIYTGIDLRLSPGILVPYVICALAAPYLALKSATSIKNKDVLALSALLLISAVGIALAPKASIYLGERIKGLIYLTYSLVLSYSFYLCLRRWESGRVAGLFGRITVVLIVGCALENYTPFKVVSDRFRALVFDPAYLYENDARDLTYFGRIRPKLFTEEPSYVALFFLLSVFIWFALAKDRHRYLKFLAAVCVGFFLIRSPIVLLALPLAVLTELLVRRDQNAIRRLRAAAARARPRKKAVVGLAIVGTLLVALALRTILRERLELVLAGGEGSTVVRLVAPALLAHHVVTTYPIWGAGITGKEFLADDLAAVYSGLGFAFRDPNKIVNAFWLFLIYYGVVAGALMAIAFYQLMLRMGVRHSLFAVTSIMAFTQGMGAFVGLRTWYVVFMVFLISYLAGTGRQRNAYVRVAARSDKGDVPQAPA